MTKNTVNIIVVTFNRINYFKTFVKFLGLSTETPFKLIVVDNGSVDGTREAILELEKEGKVWRHVFNKKNLPLAKALSAGLKKADSDFVVTVADDMVVNPILGHDWLEVFIEKMNQNRKIGCINFVGARCSHENFLEKYDR